MLLLLLLLLLILLIIVIIMMMMMMLLEGVLVFHKTLVEGKEDSIVEIAFIFALDQYT